MTKTPKARRALVQIKTLTAAAAEHDATARRIYMLAQEALDDLKEKK